MAEKVYEQLERRVSGRRWRDGRGPTAAEIIELMLEVTPPGWLRTLLFETRPALRHRRPVDLLNTVIGRRILYEWALTLGEGREVQLALAESATRRVQETNGQGPR